MIKKYILGALLALSIPLFAYASSMPVLSVSNVGNDSATLTITGGDPNAPVTLFYNPTTAGTVQRLTLGSTDVNGYWSGQVSTNANGIMWNMPVYAQVGGYQTGTWSNASSSLIFSNMTPTFMVGQNGLVYLSGGNGGTYYISSNSNQNGISAGISGNTLTLYGSKAGTGSIVVCSTGGACGTINATVNSTNGSGSTSYGSPTLSQSAVNVGFGGQGSITLSGGSAPYIVNVPAGSGITTTLMGNTLYINGNANGNTTVQVCSANGGACTPLNVTVGSATTGSTGSTSGTTSGMVGISLPFNVGTPMQLMLTGGNGSYYISSPSSIAGATINGNVLTINPSTVGTGSLSICSSGGSCTPIAFTVNPALTGTGGGFFFETDLSMGMTSEDIAELQGRLSDEGYFHGTATGYFGPITMAAVQAYQRAHGLPSTGFVGPLTRAELNK